MRNSFRCRNTGTFIVCASFEWANSTDYLFNHSCATDYHCPTDYSEQHWIKRTNNDSRIQFPNNYNNNHSGIPNYDISGLQFADNYDAIQRPNYNPIRLRLKWSNYHFTARWNK